MEHTAQILLPAPAQMTALPGKLPVSKLTTAAITPEFSLIIPDLERLFSTLALPVKTAAAPQGNITFKHQPMADGAWQMSITPDGICAAAGDIRGARYAAEALTQMLFAATVKTQPDDALDCAEIHDEPRFQWRGFMLDSARHFQDKDFVKKFLRILSAFRINSFHWHLVDSQGWRYPSKAADRLGAKGKWSLGQYTLDDLQEISQCARELGIRIIPEIDVPGHSCFLLASYPEYACDPADAKGEICIGKPETMTFIKAILEELLEIFPDSPIIHIGSDEAATTRWEKCPDCHAAMKAKKLQNLRELENDFMVELANFLIAKGRTPMIWGPGITQIYPRKTIIQAWLDLRDPLRFHKQGNKVVYSIHHSLYFDYPANLNEYWETWMLELTEQGVYMTDPCTLWQEELRDTILGPEACLWTETLPQHRVLAKMFPRLYAFSECAWSARENKSWHDYLRRREGLEAAGYLHYLQSL